MDTTDETKSAARHSVQTAPDTAYLDQLVPQQPEEDDDADFSDDPEVIFRREYAKLDTIPLHTPQHQYDEPVPARVYVGFVLLFVSFLAGAIIGLVTYPSVTITLVPVARQANLTTPLALPTRPLAPVTRTRTLSAPTTGHGHHVATAATGTLTFYNGSFAVNTVPAATVLTARDGVQVSTDQAVSVPVGNPPVYGQVTVPAHALAPGARGNIQASDLNTPCCAVSMLVKNLAAFTGGSDARDFQAVAQIDLDTLSTTLRTTLARQLPQAFPLQAGERVIPTACHVSTTADHGAGEEATTVTMKAADTCTGLAYNQDALERQTIATFTTQTNPGTPYELLNTTPPQVISVAPLTVRISGTWVYVLSPDYEQFLAQQIAGETPQQAQASLLQTGFVRRATVPAPLPKDPGHIHFLILMGG